MKCLEENMRKLLGTFLGFVFMAFLAGALVLVMSEFAAPSQSPPAAQPAVALVVPTPTPCVKVFPTPAGPLANYQAPPDAPKLSPELLTPQPILPKECADQLEGRATPWPHLDTKEPPPYMVTPKPAPPTPRPDDPLGPTRDGASSVMPRPDYLDPRSLTLIKDAEAVFIGNVAAVSPSRWGTPDGHKPATWGEYEALRSTNTALYIYTPVTLQMEQILKNAQVGKTVAVTLPGGKVDEVEFVWPDLPKLLAGKRFVIFTGLIPADHLKRIGLAGAISQPARTIIGYFEVTPDGKIPISGPGISPSVVNLNDAVAAIRDAVR